MSKSCSLVLLFVWEGESFQVRLGLVIFYSFSIFALDFYVSRQFLLSSTLNLYHLVTMLDKMSKEEAEKIAEVILSNMTKQLR